MTMKEKILETLRTMGFEVEEMEDLGYGFQYEGKNYLYMPNDEDEDFLSISIPAVMDCDDVSNELFYQLMDKLNSTLKYVKANKLGDSMWLFYERELYGGEDLEKLLAHMILHLEAGITFFRNLITSAINDDDSDGGTSAEDSEEVA